MNFSKRMIESGIEILQKELAQLKTEKKQLKGGRLKQRKRGNKIYYTEYINGKEKGITGDEQKIQILARKDEIDKIIMRVEYELEVFQKAARDLKRLKKAQDPLHVNGSYSLDDWKWMREPFQSNPLYPEHLQYVTKMGTVVRTKSELAIANALERNGIPYRYEQRIVVGGKVYYPDFTIRKLDGSIVIWEHNGAMDIEGYAEKAEERTNRYEEAGFRQHTNLIITYEEDIKSQEEIDKIIQRFVIF